MDVKRVDGKFMVFSMGGRKNTGKDAASWAVEAVVRGAGELVINSIDTDGVKDGFDIEMLSALAPKVSVPVVASGGAGKIEDFADLFEKTGVEAGLAASIFHFREVEISDLKKYLNEKGVEVRV